MLVVVVSVSVLFSSMYQDDTDGEERELVALLGLSSWCLVIVLRLFLAVSWVCLRFESVVFPDHTHLLFIKHSKVYVAKWPPIGRCANLVNHYVPFVLCLFVI